MHVHPRELDLERGWPGRIDGDVVVQLAAQTLQAFFSGGSSAREHAVYPLADVVLRAPVLEPPVGAGLRARRRIRVREPGRGPLAGRGDPPAARAARRGGPARRGDRGRGRDRRLDRSRRVARAGAAAAEGPRLRAPARAGRRDGARRTASTGRRRARSRPRTRACGRATCSSARCSSCARTSRAARSSSASTGSGRFGGRRWSLGRLVA